MPLLDAYGINGQKRSCENQFCSICERSFPVLTIIDDVTSVCDKCLDENYRLCDVCGQYWYWDAIEFTELDDGRCVCEYCMEDLEDEEDEDDEEDE